MTAKTQTAAQPAMAPPVASGLLQRQCACGQHTVAGGECPQCRKDREEGKPAEVPDVIHDVLRSAGEPLDSATRALLEPRFGADFSRVPVRLSAAPARELTIAR